MKYIILLIALAFAGLTHAESVSVVQISPKYCKEGVHKQPKGQFALYVFCDDALGTNVSIFLSDLGAPLRGSYRLTKRFWQSDEWGADVTSFSWLPSNKYLLLSTSAVYGSGKVYKLNLESQASEVVYIPNENTCLTELVAIENNKAHLKVTDCELKAREVEIAI